MFQANEDSIVKSLEIIAKCMIKSNQMAEEAIKKSQELYEANVAIMKENQKETEITDKGLKKLLTTNAEKEAEEILPDLDDTGSQI